MRKAGLISLILFLAVLSFAQDAPKDEPKHAPSTRKNASDSLRSRASWNRTRWINLFTQKKPGPRNGLRTFRIST